MAANLPPELAAALAGAMGGAAGGAAPQPGMGMEGPPPEMAGPPPEMAGPPPQGGSGGGLYGGVEAGDNVEALRAALDALQAYAEGEDDEQNIQTVLKCVAALQGILANEQKQQDAMMGGKLDPAALRKMAGRG